MSTPHLGAQAPVAQRWAGKWTVSNPDLRFWVSFLALNAILFTPFFLLEFHGSEIQSRLGVLSGGPLHLVSWLLWRRETSDVFRFSAEMIVLAAIWVNFRRLRRPAFLGLASVTYVAVLLYHIYEGVTVSLYKAEPAFYNQYFLARDGIAFLLRHLDLAASQLMLAAGAAIVAMAIAVAVVRVLLAGSFPENDLSRPTRIVLAGLALALILAGTTSRTALAQRDSVFSSLAAKLETNVETSIELYSEVHAFDEASFRQAYALDSLNLQERPNVYLIFVESYGSVLYRRPDYKIAYTALLEELQADLVAGGWQVSSALSESTTWGGGSWLAYTSALFGMPIESHPQYLALLDRFGGAENPYPSLARLLKSQGYQTFWISSIAEEINDTLWREYHNFFGVDRWLRHSDLEYDGAQYGWGPAPPDQYVLEYVRAKFVNASDQPSFLFFITQNSHFPWQIPPLVDNWRALLELDEDGSETGTPDDVPHQELRMAYMNAIEYELRFLTKSVLDTGDENAIFILIGDHQPPRVSRRNDSFDTPIHIITRNQHVTDVLRSYGFEDGLVVRSETPALKHEGLYSLLRHVLAAGFGKQDDPLPDYLPDGVPSVVEASAEPG